MHPVSTHIRRIGIALLLALLSALSGIVPGAYAAKAGSRRASLRQVSGASRAVIQHLTANAVCRDLRQLASTAAPRGVNWAPVNAGLTNKGICPPLHGGLPCIHFTLLGTNLAGGCSLEHGTIN